ncbi:MAG: hypothetical protein NTW94_09665, partial [Legionellales bacterium]|nr:hypothetical protein [Legionellales bacterium]
MFTQSRITLLSELALKSYHEAIRPDPFAAIAAHTLAVDAAAFYNPASADAAGFVAISSMINLSGYSAHLASLATEMHEMMKHYHAKTESRHLESKTVVPAFNALIHSLESVTFDRDVRAIYHSTFSTHASDDAQLALSAACKTFPHALATTRS